MLKRCRRVSAFESTFGTSPWGRGWYRLLFSQIHRVCSMGEDEHCSPNLIAIRLWWRCASTKVSNPKLGGSAMVLPGCRLRESDPRYHITSSNGAKSAQGPNLAGMRCRHTFQRVPIRRQHFPKNFTRVHATADVSVSYEEPARRCVYLRGSPCGTGLTHRLSTRNHAAVAQQVMQAPHVVGNIFGATSTLPCGLRADSWDAHARGFAVERSRSVADDP